MAGRVSTEVELNRRRWKSIGRSPSNNSHATSIVATCSVARSYKISLRAWGKSERRKQGEQARESRERRRNKRRKRIEKEKENGERYEIMKPAVSLPVHRRIARKVFCNFARALPSNWMRRLRTERSLCTFRLIPRRLPVLYMKSLLCSQRIERRSAWTYRIDGWNILCYLLHEIEAALPIREPRVSRTGIVHVARDTGNCGEATK